ncbi:MAG: type II toxin-antitoxin system RelE/ParE family toxin [Clostridiales Family XIII bacterium]|jgi:plasmid stabilization system protein ParE|nr:type II toxin-antitoxin system RelE/ParE family toxin [Clostridiales Family XIII bacterium]
MTYKVTQSVPADLDLDGIVFYIVGQLKNPKAAKELLGEYEERLKNLRTSPKLYRLSRFERLARMGYRVFPFGNYLGFYTIDEAEKEVFIVRLFHQRQDYEAYF